ncbi:MAG TPA: hypothetical protein VFK38_03225 [Candidatus Limnocylindrales bacterium]|nr:hypothetical protein [Candidatus Limnocylindrales bacterium]
MRRLITILAVLLLSLALAGPAAAHSPCVDFNADGSPSGWEYGQFHISSHTPHGRGIDGAHNPGTHMGFSLCLGVHS